MSVLNPPPVKVPPKLLADREIGGFFSALIQSIYLMFVRLDGINISSGASTPEGAVTGRIGDLFLRTDGGAGSTLYVKESGTGNTGWAAK